MKKKKAIKKDFIKVLKPITVTIDGEVVYSMEVVCETKPYFFKRESGFKALEFGDSEGFMYHKIRVNYTARVHFNVKSNTYIDTNFRVIYNDKFYRIAYLIVHKDPTYQIWREKDKIITAYLIDE